MGLDITAYQTFEILPAHERSDACWDEDNHHTTLCYVGFEQSFRGLPIVRVDPKEGIAYGPSVRTSGRTIQFRAGSYGGYNQWRDNLALIALGVNASAVHKTPEAYKDMPFFELINFADNEGNIGPEACADLARDFAEHQDVRAKLTQWDADLFDQWALAFALAANTGLVSFH